MPWGGGQGDAGVVGEYGFSYRLPTARQISCFERGRDAPFVTEETDVDWLCTFHGAGVSGYIYVRNAQALPIRDRL